MATPVVFVHGLWLHADSWGAWVDRFGEAGYAPVAPGWPGDSPTVEETRKQPGRVAGHGIDDVVAHYADVIRQLDAKPIVIGHSFGGLVVQRLLGDDLAAAAIAIDPAPVKGVLILPLSALRVASVALLNPLNKKRAVALTADQFRYGFGNAISAAESAELYERWTIPSPGRPLFRGRIQAKESSSARTARTDSAGRDQRSRSRSGTDRAVPATARVLAQRGFRSANFDATRSAESGGSRHP